jgi:hypothetical protein
MCAGGPREDLKGCCQRLQVASSQVRSDFRSMAKLQNGMSNATRRHFRLDPSHKIAGVGPGLSPAIVGIMPARVRASDGWYAYGAHHSHVTSKEMFQARKDHGLIVSCFLASPGELQKPNSKLQKSKSNL